MRDPAKRDDLLDRLKYIPIGADDVYLTLSGELRARVNYFSNPQGRKAEHQRQDSYRIFLGADLHLGEHFRAYGELARGPMDGKNIGSPSGTLSNGLLLQQAFVDGTAQIGQVDVGARVGRQVFIDGSNLLLANRDNNTVQTSLTGVRAWARGSRLRADAFDLYYTTYGNGGIGDDPVDWGRRFSGITTGIVLPKQLFGGSSCISIRSSGVCATARSPGEPRQRARSASMSARICGAKPAPSRSTGRPIIRAAATATGNWTHGRCCWPGPIGWARRTTRPGSACMSTMRPAAAPMTGAS